MIGVMQFESMDVVLYLEKNDRRLLEDIVVNNEIYTRFCGEK